MPRVANPDLDVLRLLQKPFEELSRLLQVSQSDFEINVALPYVLRLVQGHCDAVLAFDCQLVDKPCSFVLPKSCLKLGVLNPSLAVLREHLHLSFVDFPTSVNLAQLKLELCIGFEYFRFGAHA